MSCSICNNQINEENAPIIAMGGTGRARYICDRCAEDVERATRGREPEEIRESIKRLAERMSEFRVEDEVVISSVNSILEGATERANLIEDGSYDFLAEEEAEVEDDVPEELAETEEDRALDEAENEKNKKIDKIFNWITAGICVLAVVGVVLLYILR